jgi:hypothetical protein
VTKIRQISPQYVETIPGTLRDGVLYISLKYSTAVHRCCCGCGTKIVTPLSPAHWVLTTAPTAETVTLHPSIGNWNHPCQAHYLIQRNRVVWAGQMTSRQIARGRTLTQAGQERVFGRHGQTHATDLEQVSSSPSAPGKMATSEGLIARFWRWLDRR